MSDDRSLTEFSATEESVSDDDRSDSDPTDTDPNTEPAMVSYRWQPDGAVCTQCGESTQKQWFDSGAFVCPDCKSWT